MFGVRLGGGPDAFPVPDVHRQMMSVERVQLRVAINRDGDAITGTVTRLGGEVRKFSGRLGLFSAIDDEIEGIAPRPAEPREIDDVDG